MKEEGFADFMTRNKKSESTVKRYVGSAKSHTSARQMGVMPYLGRCF